MKSLWINLILVAAVLVAGSHTSYAQSPEQLYQKGLMKEEGEGELQDAIELYSQIVDNSDADQSLRAKALLHIGLCYERMGTKEAVNAYQRLVNNFPSQKNEVAIAKERLNSLILADKPAQKDVKADLIIRKVLPNTEIEPLGAPSPDGRYLSFVDWSTGGDICILDLITKEKRCVTDYTDENEQTYSSSWSPDGRQIAYFWWRYDKEQYNLSVVDVKISESRDLIVSDTYDWIELGNWSSDGKYIFATLYLRDEQKSQIVRVSVTDGAIEILKTCEESYTGGKPYVSPDSRFVAFDIKGMDASGNNDIVILSIENGRLSNLIEHPSHDYILGWSPDGNSILFATDRTGTVDAMLIAVKEGKPVGQPVSVKQNIGPVVPMGLTKDGSFFYGQWPSADNIFSAEIDIHEGRLLSEPFQLIQKFAGRNYSPAYSSDGKYLAYISDRGVLDKGKPGSVLCIRNLETLEENAIIADPDVWGGLSNPQWSPDDQSIILTCDNKEGLSRIYKYDIPTKDFSLLVQESQDQSSDDQLAYPIQYAYPIWAKDGKSVFYLQFSRYTSTSRLMAWDISSGSEKELYSYSSDDLMDRLFNISLSPDGEWIAAINRGENRVIRLISTDGQEKKDLYSFRSPGGFPFSPIWSKDGTYIVFPYQDLKSSDFYSREWGLMRIPFAGGEGLHINMDILGVASPTLHPDGHTLSFRSAGTSFPENNIWEMKNFLRLGNVSDQELAKEPEGIRIRQVWKEPYLDFLGSVSADGRLLSYIHWGEGDVAVHNLATGEDQVLLHEADLDTIPESFAQSPKISKDGSQIAYFMWNPYHTFDLRLTDVTNPVPRTIYKEEGIEVYPRDWLSDQELITCRQNRNTEKTTVSLFNVSEGTYRDLKEFYGRTWGNMAASPDEKYIAHDFKDRKYEGNRDIKLLPVDGSGEISLISHPANDRVLGWDPDNKVLLFTSDRSGDWDLWALPIKDGKPSGPEKRLYTGIGDVEPVGFTENGDCYFGFSKRYFNTSLAPFNSLTGEIEDESAISLEGSHFRLTWSPDGQHLAYIKEDNKSDAPSKLTIKDLKTGEERGFGENLHASAHAWSPDGNSILFIGRELNKLHTQGYIGDIYLTNIQTGQTEKILSLSDYEFNLPEDDHPPLSNLAWSPDGQSFFMLFFKDRIIKHDLRSGEDEVIFEHANFEPYILQCSPDGTTLLFGTQNEGEKAQLYTMPAGGGNMEELCNAQEADDFISANWSSDGEYIYFSESPEGTNLWRIPATGGKPEKVWHSENITSIYNIHPDGKQIAYSQRVRTTEVRVIENLSNEIARVFNKLE